MLAKCLAGIKKTVSPQWPGTNVLVVRRKLADAIAGELSILYLFTSPGVYAWGTSAAIDLFSFLSAPFRGRDWFGGEASPRIDPYRVP